MTKDQVLERLAYFQPVFRPGPPDVEMISLIRDARKALGLDPEPDRRTREDLLEEISSLKIQLEVVDGHA